MASVRLHLFGRGLELTAKALTAPYSPGTATGGGWYPLVVREPYAGAWQVNVEGRRDQILQYAPVFACVTLIAQDIGKLALHLVEQNDDEMWEETSSPAFSPVLRRPNRYQTTTKFVEQWITSKLMWGNAYILKERDARGVVVALYVLDPLRCTPLIAPDGGVYYQLQHDNLSGSLALAREPADKFILPASEIIHDRMVCLFHPLVGMSPIYACAMAAQQGNAIQNSSSVFFTNASRPSAFITTPPGVSEEQLAALAGKWNTAYSGAKAGTVAAFTGDLKYTQLTMNAVDAQLIQQLGWTAETICSCYHVPSFLIGVGELPRGVSLESLWQMYHSLCLQSLITNFENALDEGLGLAMPINGTQYGTELDIDDLIWLDTTSKTKAAADAIGAGAMSPDEARERYFGLGPVEGGDTPYMQQQMFSLKALAQRDKNDPFSKPAPAPMAAPAGTPEPQLTAEELKDLAPTVISTRRAEAGSMTRTELDIIATALAPVVRDYVTATLAEVVTRTAVLDKQLAALVTATTEIGTMRERLAVLETRAPVPGPPGPAGRDGVDGLGFDDLGVTQADDRSVTITATRGDVVKEIGTAHFALDIYRGVWLEGKAYEPGDGVTWAGSEWHCSAATTTKPGDGSKAWTLKVKRGRDGKDGKDGGPGPIGPAGKDWQQVYDDTRRR